MFTPQPNVHSHACILHDALNLGLTVSCDVSRMARSVSSRFVWIKPSADERSSSYLASWSSPLSYSVTPRPCLDRRCHDVDQVVVPLAVLTSRRMDLVLASNVPHTVTQVLVAPWGDVLLGARDTTTCHTRDWSAAFGSPLQACIAC